VGRGREGRGRGGPQPKVFAGFLLFRLRHRARLPLAPVRNKYGLAPVRRLGNRLLTLLRHLMQRTPAEILSLLLLLLLLLPQPSPAAFFSDARLIEERGPRIIGPSLEPITPLTRLTPGRVIFISSLPASHGPRSVPATLAFHLVRASAGKAGQTHCLRDRDFGRGALYNAALVRGERRVYKKPFMARGIPFGCGQGKNRGEKITGKKSPIKLSLRETDEREREREREREIERRGSRRILRI
jgi:hypothetical protein